MSQKRNVRMENFQQQKGGGIARSFDVTLEKTINDARKAADSEPGEEDSSSCTRNGTWNGHGSSSRQQRSQAEEEKKCADDSSETGQFVQPEEEDFWTEISALRNTQYGIAMWCIVWNGVGLWLLAGLMAGPLLLNIGLGLGHLFSGWQTKRIAKQRNFRGLLCLAPSTLLFIQFAMLVLQQSLAETFGAFKFALNAADFRAGFHFDNRLDSILAIGNSVLMAFVCYCDLLVLRMICAKVGARLDSHWLAIRRGTQQMNASSYPYP